VLRCVEGGEIELRDSSAAAYVAVVNVLRPQVVVRIASRIAQAVESELAITLAQCLPKGSKMDYVVEKATELGALRIVPVLSERVVGAREGGGKLERWRRLAKTAAQQCGAARITEVEEIAEWASLLETFAAYDRVLLPWELSEAQPRALDALMEGVRSVLIVVGPEGGFSHREVDLAEAEGAKAISLGRRILRTETAGLLAIACVRYASGEV
jgi:16S rRNA (uracil1498-N3)-methyltransferase